MRIALDLEEWQKVSFDTHLQLRDARLLDDERTQMLAQELSGESSGKPQRLVIRQLRQGLALECTSFVGRISLGDLQVTIRPKIKMLPLLHLLQYAYSLRHLDRFDATGFGVESWTFQDLLIFQLEREARELLTRGLHRTYARREEQLSAPRGSLSFQKLTRRGGLIQDALPCVYYSRLEDGVLNQALLAGLRLGIRLSSDDEVRARLQHLANFQLAPVSSVRLTSQLLQQATRAMSRLTAAYAPALTLVRILLASEEMSLDGEELGLPLPGFLFDMNRFFQDLLQRFLQEYLPDAEVVPQYEVTDLFSYVDNPQRKKPPELRPDYVVKHRGKVVAILDAKYRDLWGRELPPHMLYQLVMYSLSHADCNAATILYPTTAPQTRVARIEVRLPGQKPTSVILRPVDLLRLEKLVIRERERNERECGAYAEWLAFGIPS